MPNNLVYRTPRPPPNRPYDVSVYGDFRPLYNERPKASALFVELGDLLSRTVSSIDNWMAGAFAAKPRVVGTWLRAQGVSVQRSDLVDLTTHALLVGAISGIAVGVLCTATAIPEPTAIVLGVTCAMLYHHLALDGCFNP